MLSFHGLKSLVFACLTSVVFAGCMGGENSGSDPVSSGGSSGNTSSLPRLWSDVSTLSGMSLYVASYFPNDMPSSMNDGSTHIIDDMQDQWDNAVGSKTFFRDGLSSVPNRDYSSLSSYNDGEMGVYRSTGWFSNVSSSVLAVTQYYGILRNAGTSNEYVELTHADIIVNYRDFDYVWDNSLSGNEGEYDLPSILLHELGHFLGLGHTPYGSNAVMAPTIDGKTQYRSLKSRDTSNIQWLYTSGVDALSSGVVVSGATSSDPSPDEGKPVRGIIELSASGECRHLVNGQVKSAHQVEL